MSSELFGCLELTEKRSSALLIGYADTGVANYLAGQYGRVVVVDFLPERLELIGKGERGNIETRLYDDALSYLTDSRFNYVAIIFGSLITPEVDTLVRIASQLLEPRGRLELIEPVSRPGTEGQAISARLLKIDFLLQRGANGDSFNGDLSEPQRKLAIEQLANEPNRGYNDPDLLFPTAFWQGEWDRVVSQKAEASKQSAEVGELIGEIERLVGEGYVPATPPFNKQSGRLKGAVAGQQRFVKEPQAVAFPTVAPPLTTSKTEPVRTTVVQTVFTSREVVLIPALDGETVADPLYKRLLTKGVESLQAYELLTVALVNRDGDFGPDVIEQVRQTVLQDYGAKAVGDERNPAILATQLGITIPQACRIVAIFELGRRFFSPSAEGGRAIRSPEDAHIYLQDMASLKKETFRGLYLNVQGYIVHDEVISIGTLVKSLVHPREVFLPAIACSAHSLVVAHNHPSGELTPSEADINVTKQLYQSAQILGIELVDHLIISTNGFYSFKREGKFPLQK